MNGVTEGINVKFGISETKNGEKRKKKKDVHIFALPENCLETKFN